jgi:hypothetical protein
MSMNRGILDTRSGFSVDGRYKRSFEVHKVFPDITYRKSMIRIPKLLMRILLRFYDGGKINPFNLGYFQNSSSLTSLRNLRNYDLYDRLVVHVRLTDYSLKFSKDIEIDLERKIHLHNYEKYVVTDDYEAFCQLFPHLSELLIHFNANSIDEWLFIAESKVVFISDSSFSFTSAYLGNDKTIYYPSLTHIKIDDKGNHKWERI